MQFLVAALLGGFAQVLASYVGRVLVALGLTYVTYKGVSVATDACIAYVKSSFGSVGGEAGNLLSYLYVDKALSLMFSAFTSALAIKTASGSVTKLVFKK